VGRKKKKRKEKTKIAHDKALRKKKRKRVFFPEKGKEKKCFPKAPNIAGKKKKEGPPARASREGSASSKKRKETPSAIRRKKKTPFDALESEKIMLRPKSSAAQKGLRSLSKKDSDILLQARGEKEEGKLHVRSQVLRRKKQRYTQ